MLIFLKTLSWLYNIKFVSGYIGIKSSSYHLLTTSKHFSHIQNGQNLSYDYNGIEYLSQDPLVFTVEHFLSDDQCRNLIHRGLTFKLNSNSINTQSKTFLNRNGISSRSSSTYYIPEVNEDYINDGIINLVSKLIRIDKSHFEELQLTCYDIGQQYSWHYDSIPKSLQRAWGNRIATIIIYLNTLDENQGGNTIFKYINSTDSNIQLSIRPMMGKALVFFPSDISGISDDRTLHKGEVVLQSPMKVEVDDYIGSKWIAQM